MPSPGAACGLWSEARPGPATGHWKQTLTGCVMTDDGDDGDTPGDGEEERCSAQRTADRKKMGAGISSSSCVVVVVVIVA